MPALDPELRDRLASSPTKIRAAVSTGGYVARRGLHATQSEPLLFPSQLATAGPAAPSHSTFSGAAPIFQSSAETLQTVYLELCSNLSPKKALQPMYDTFAPPTGAAAAAAAAQMFGPQQGQPQPSSPFFDAPTHAVRSNAAFSPFGGSPSAQSPSTSTLYPYSPTKASGKRMAAEDDDRDTLQEADGEDEGMATEPEDAFDEEDGNFLRQRNTYSNGGGMDLDGDASPPSPTRSQRVHKGLPRRAGAQQVQVQVQPGATDTGRRTAAFGLSARPLSSAAGPRRTGLQKTQSLPPDAFLSAIEF